MTVPTGRSAGSLQVVAVSPLRAAGWPLIITVLLPMMIWPLLAGGFWNGPPWGMWGGMLSAVELRIAAGMPPIITSLESPPESIPAKGCGSGVGVLYGGIRMMWVSVAITWSPCLAAGMPMVICLLSMRGSATHGEVWRNSGEAWRNSGEAWRNSGEAWRNSGKAWQLTARFGETPARLGETPARFGDSRRGLAKLRRGLATHGEVWRNSGEVWQLPTRPS